jgi:hypothetical protein
MKNIIYILFALMFASAVAKAQATDFTATDCNSVSYNFFTELNSGKVVVLDWVMPCSACIPASVSAYNIVQSYSSSQVVLYLIDDVGNATCSTLNNWANANGIATGTTVFNNSGTPINQAYYGGSGMPHVTVVGPDHQIYFNGLSGAANNPTGITNGINQALLANGITLVENNFFNLFVVVKSEVINVKYSLNESSNVTLTMFNMMGQNIGIQEPGKQATGEYTADFDLSSVGEGIYFIRLSTENKSQTVKFSVSR